MNGGDFCLREWTVCPSLNRLVLLSDENPAQIHVEPKHMDVLVHLAANAGEVVSKEKLLAGSWQQQYVADAVLTRAVAELRRALGDDAHDPRFIETIPRRGYRLIADVQTPVQEPPPSYGLGWIFPAALLAFGFAVGWELSRSVTPSKSRR